MGVHESVYFVLGMSALLLAVSSLFGLQLLEADRRADAMRRIAGCIEGAGTFLKRITKPRLLFWA